MFRFAFACVLSAVMCSTGLSQDSRPETKGEKRGEARVQKKRGEERGQETARRTRTEPQRPESDPRAALRKRLGELVQSGKLTREEAVQLYTIAFPERSRDQDAGRGGVPAGLLHAAQRPAPARRLWRDIRIRFWGLGVRLEATPNL